MTKLPHIIAPLLLALAACGTPRPEELKLPEEAPKKAFTYVGESFLRGVKGSYNTTPRGRSPAVLQVRYEMECLHSGKSGAKARYNKARTLLKKEYLVAPYYFKNPRERGYWRRNASELLVKNAGCQVLILDDKPKDLTQREVIFWAIKNKVPPARK